MRITTSLFSKETRYQVVYTAVDKFTEFVYSTEPNLWLGVGITADSKENVGFLYDSRHPYIELGFDTRISVKQVLRDQERAGFSDPFHKVMFLIESDGIDSVEIGLWVHRRYPDDELVKVARSFLTGRLTDMTTVASEEAYSPSEVDTLWQKVKPV